MHMLAFHTKSKNAICFYEFEYPSTVKFYLCSIPAKLLLSLSRQQEARRLGWVERELDLHGLQRAHVSFQLF